MKRVDIALLIGMSAFLLVFVITPCFKAARR